MSAAILLVALSVLLGVVDAVPTCPPHCHAGGANGVLRLPGCDGCLELRPDELEHAVVDATAAGVNVVPRLARPVENACGPSCARLPPTRASSPPSAPRALPRPRQTLGTSSSREPPSGRDDPWSSSAA